MDKTLKPCPFCGAEAELMTAEQHNFDFDEAPKDQEVCVYCKDCKACTLAYQSKEEAAEAWNRRV